MKELQQLVKTKTLEEVMEFKKWLNKYIEFENKSQFKIGDKVWFETPKYGRINGVIDKINPKTISVKDTVSELGRTWRGWKVHPVHLNKGE